MESAPTITPLPAGPIEPPDLTNTLQQGSKRLAGTGSFGTVYRCWCARNGEVAVKAISFHPFIDQTKKDEFLRKMRRELGLWKRLDHPNIVPFLGTAQGGDFGSDHPCMVSMWMPYGTLDQFVKQRESELSLPSRIRLITGSAAGLEYLHSQCIIHGDFHPGNILIDHDYNSRLTDFGLSQTLNPQNDLTYLWTASTRAGAAMWVAPELLCAEPFPNPLVNATLHSDIYSLGSIILFILSGKSPWNRGEIESKLKALENPPRPVSPVIPDGVWDFIERCWSPRLPSNRPSAQEVLSFSRDKLEQFFQPNVVLFGTLGCGKSSIINLLAEDAIAQESADVEPCTKRPWWYQISIDERRSRLWDTSGFRLARLGNNNRLLPYKQVHAVLRNLPNGVNLILFCARKDEISASLGSLYRFVNDFLCGGQVPIAFVITHVDTPDERWWERNQDIITRRTGIPVQSIPHLCVTTVQTGCDQSKQALRELLQTNAAAVAPSRAAATDNLTTDYGLSPPEMAALKEMFSKPLRPFNVVFFGETGAGMSSVINLLVGYPVAEVSLGMKTCTLESRSYRISTGTQQFVVWDTMGLSDEYVGQDACGRALENAARLIRDLQLSGKGGIDLLVFCKKPGQLTTFDVCTLRLFEALCEGQVPVAVVVTHLEWQDRMEEWWETNGDGLVKAIGRDVIGHACITSLANDHASAIGLKRKLSESGLSVQGMLEDCISTSAKSTPKKPGMMGSAAKKMIATNLVDRCGLTKKQAEELLTLRYGSG